MAWWDDNHVNHCQHRTFQKWSPSPVLSISVVTASDLYAEEHRLESYSGLWIFSDYPINILPIILIISESVNSNYLRVTLNLLISCTGHQQNTNSVHFSFWYGYFPGKIWGKLIQLCGVISRALLLINIIFLFLLVFITGKTGYMYLSGFDFLDSFGFSRKPFHHFWAMGDTFFYSSVLMRLW